MARMIDADALKEAISEIPIGVSMYATSAESKAVCRFAARMYGLIDEATTIGGWISVKDRMPEKAGIYIICDHYGNVMSRHFCKGRGKFAGYWHLNGSAKYGNPRYWMPLPEPPEEVTVDG